MYSSTPSFDSSLVLKLSGSSSTSPSRLPRMLVEYQPVDAEHPRLEHRREHGLDHRLAGLEILAADGHAAILRQLLQRGDVAGEVGGAVGERHPLHDGGPGVQHGRRDGRVVGVHRLLERLERLVGRARLDEDLGGRAPDHDQPVALVLRLESPDVLAQRLGQFPLGLALSSRWCPPAASRTAGRTPPASA